MPCHVDPPTAAERAAASKYFEKTVNLFDRLTHRNDILREAVLDPEYPGTSKLIKAATDDFDKDFADAERWASRGSFASPDHKYMVKATDAYAEFLGLVNILNGDTKLTVKERKAIEKRQVEHRIEDLKRLARVAIDKWDMELLQKVVGASPNFPLEPQLGFDPDSM
jgi:hypothetical protein